MQRAKTWETAGETNEGPDGGRADCVLEQGVVPGLWGFMRPRCLCGNGRGLEAELRVFPEAKEQRSTDWALTQHAS